MFFEKTGGRLEWALRGLGALTGATAGGVGTYKATEGLDMNPLARSVQIGQNTLAGGIFGGAPKEILQNAIKYIKPNPLRAAAAAPLIFGAEEAIPQGINLLQQTGHNMAESAKEHMANETTQKVLQKAIPFGIGAGGVLGLAGLGSYLAKPNKGSFSEGAGGAAPSSGRMMLTLPPSKHNPNPTVLDLPMTGLRIPKKTLSHIGRDTRRVLRLDSADRDVDLANAGA